MLIRFVDVNSAPEVTNFLYVNKQNLTGLKGHMGFVQAAFFFGRKNIINDKNMLLSIFSTLPSAFYGTLMDIYQEVLH